jgi:hypothetical protein
LTVDRRDNRERPIRSGEERWRQRTSIKQQLRWVTPAVLLCDHCLEE